MIDIHLAVRTAYFTALNGNVVYNGKTLPVYDSYADNDAEVPYIVLTDQTSTPSTEGRCRFVQNASMQFEVVTGFPIGAPGLRAGGRKQSEDIANIIYPLIGMSKNSADWLNFGAGLYTGETELQFSSYLIETQQIKGGYFFVYRKITRIGHLISQN